MTKDRLLYGTAYLLLLLFANMYGFWVSFSVNVFAFLGLSEFLTSAIKFVAAQLTTFVVAVLALMVSAMLLGYAGGWALKKVSADAHTAFKRNVHKFDLSEAALIRTFIILTLIGLAFLLALDKPYGLAMLWAMLSIWVGLWLAGRITRDTPSGPRKSFRVAATIFLSVAPVVVYMQARSNAERVKQGCMPTRISAESAKEYGFNLTAGAESPTYLGSAGEHFFFYEHVSKDFWVLRLPEGKSLRFVRANGRPAICKKSLVRLRDYSRDSTVPE